MSSANRRCSIALLTVVIATPLVIVPGVFLRYFTTPKLVVLYLAAALLLTSLGAWWPGLILLARTRYGALFCAGLLAEVASLLASAALSNQPVLAFAGTSATRLGAVTQITTIIVAAALAGYVVLHRSFARKVMLAMELTAAIAAVYGIAQYLGWDPLLSVEGYTQHIPEALIRPPATLGHATYFAAFLLPGTLIAAAGLEAGPRRWMHAGVFGCCTLAIVLSGARSALLGLALGGLILAYARMIGAGSKRLFTYLPIMFAAVAVIVAVLALSPPGQSLRVRISQWTRDPAGGTRLLVWRDSLQLIRGHPLTGIGPDTFTGEFRRIQSSELSRKYPDHYHEDPHNLLLGVAVAQGVPGLATLVVLIGCAVACGFESFTLLAALSALTIALEFTPLTPPNWLYFVVLIALLVSSQIHSLTVAARKHFGVGNWVGGCAAAVVVAIAMVFAVQDAAMASTGHSAANGDLDRARQSYALSARLIVPSDDVWCSQQIAAMAKRSDSPKREAALELAKAASSRAEHNSEIGFIALVQSAALSMITGDDRTAETKLKLAASAAPGWYRPHLSLSALLSAEGRIAEASREREIVIALTGDDRPLRQAATQLRRRSEK